MRLLRIITMEIIEVQEHARKLLDAHGDKAEYEAAQKAKHFKLEGDQKQAGDWMKIREVINQMRGPHVS